MITGICNFFVEGFIMSITKVKMLLGLFFFLIAIISATEVCAIEKPEKYKGKFGVKAGIIGGCEHDKTLFGEDSEPSLGRPV